MRRLTVNAYIYILLYLIIHDAINNDLNHLL